MKIQILGTGCSKCKQFEVNAKEALKNFSGFSTVEKVEDITEIMKYNISSTPAIVINDEVKSSGRLLSVDEIVEIIKSMDK